MEGLGGYDVHIDEGFVRVPIGGDCEWLFCQRGISDEQIQYLSENERF